jgi:hypothetical protein
VSVNTIQTVSQSVRTNVACAGKLRFLLLLAALVPAPSLFLPAAAQQTTGREITFPITIRWNRQRGVNKYRLQIAADERFEDVFFDRRVIGDRYVVKELSPGYYFWRAAPAELQVGEFSRPIRFFISGGVVMPVPLPGRATRSHASRISMVHKVQSQGLLEDR